jgi:hypothetical protein
MKLSTLHFWWRPLTSYLVFAPLSNLAPVDIFTRHVTSFFLADSALASE